MPDVGQKDTQLESATNLSPLDATKPIVVLTLEGFQQRLGQLAADVGSKAELGRRLGVSGQFIDLLIAGKRTPGKKLLAAIGARKRVMIEIELEAE